MGTVVAPNLSYADALRRLFNEVRTTHGCLACDELHVTAIRSGLPYVCGCFCHDALSLLLATKVIAPATPAKPKRARGG